MGGDKRRRGGKGGEGKGMAKGLGSHPSVFRPSPLGTWRTGQDGLPGRMVSTPSVLLKR